jgi:DNA-binding CsgD family transcriptional regulator
MAQSGAETIIIERSGLRLTDRILDHDEQDLREALKSIASEIGIRNIAYLQFASERDCEAYLPTAINTYSRAWQTRYFVSGYVDVDPVVHRGRKALLPFDWETLSRNDPVVGAFFDDAAKHGVGRNGVSIPIRRGKAQALVSFASDLQRLAWTDYKQKNMASFQKLSFLIDSAARRIPDLPLEPVRLSRREEECLTWAARGKTDKEIADALEIGSGSVKIYLDGARHKLHCMSLTQAIAVAIATGVISPQSFQ